MAATYPKSIVMLFGMECSWNICCPRSDQQVLQNGTVSWERGVRWEPGEARCSTAQPRSSAGGIHFIKPSRTVNSIQSEQGLRASAPTRGSQGHSQTDELRSNCFKSRPVTTATAHAGQAQAYLIYGHFCKDTEGKILRYLQESKFVWLHILHTAGKCTGGKLFRGKRTETT